MKTAIQGHEASFSDIAARKFFGENYSILACQTFKEVFKALAKSEADGGVIALENSLYGSINEVYDLLLKYKLWIEGEVYLRIEQCLIGLRGTTIASIKEVHSHPVALAQCEEYLDTTLAHAERFEHHDTAGSVADVKKWGDPSKAAIASSTAASLHGLKILAHKIETHKQNYTRFVVLRKDKAEVPAANKTSLILGIADQVKGFGDMPGALYQALGAFAKQNINLTKLQSRPLVGRAWHYIFYADVDAGLQEPKLQAALAELKSQDCEVTILGSYLSGR